MIDKVNDHAKLTLPDPPIAALARDLLERSAQGKIASAAIVVVTLTGEIAIHVASDSPGGSVDGPKIVLGTEQLKRTILEQLFPSVQPRGGILRASPGMVI